MGAKYGLSQPNKLCLKKNRQINYGWWDTNFYAQDKNHKEEHHLQNVSGCDRKFGS